MNIVIRICMISLFWAASVAGVEVLLDATDSDKLPANFRTVLDPFRADDQREIPSRVGFEKLKASGSAQFSVKELEAIIARLNVKKLAIVDLRQESHGHVNEVALSWYGKLNAANKGMMLSEIQKREERLLQRAVIKEKIRVKTDRAKSAKTMAVYQAISEETLAKNYGLHYIRIPVLDNCGPTAEDINRFVEFVKQLPKGTWVHFHCRQGIGRTTTFLVLYDILHNAKKVDLVDISGRNLLIGGIDILAKPQEGHVFYNCQVARRSIIVQFYHYCRKNRDNFKTPFTLKW